MTCNFIEAPRISTLFNGGSFTNTSRVQSMRLVLCYDDNDIDDTDFVDVGDTYAGPYITLNADGTFDVDLEQLYTDFPEAGCEPLPLKVYQCFGDSSDLGNCTYTISSINPLMNIGNITVVYELVGGTPTLVFNWLDELDAFSSDWSICVELINSDTDTTLNQAELELDGASWQTPTIINETIGTWLEGTLEQDIAGIVGQNMELSIDEMTLTQGNYIFRFALKYCDRQTSWFPYTFEILDTTAPIKLSSTPNNGDTDVSRLDNISITFSEEMNPDTINQFEVVDSSNSPVTGTWSTVDNETYTFDPVFALAYNEVYSLNTINPVADLAGNTLPAGTCASFTTELPPQLTKTGSTPTDGAIDVDMENTTFSITFSNFTSGDQSANLALTDSGGTPVAGVWSTVDNTTYTFTPDGGVVWLSEEEYSIDITSTITDINGSSIDPETCVTFTSEDNEAPTKQSTVPNDNATDVAIDSNVSITFSEEMDPNTINELQVEIQGGAAVAGSWSTADNITFTFDPTADLANDETYDLVTLNAVADLNGNTLPAGTCASFTTVAAAVQVAKVSSSPTDNATDVDPDVTTFSITFNTPLDVGQEGLFVLEDSANNAVTGVWSTGDELTYTFTPDGGYTWLSEEEYEFRTTGVITAQNGTTLPAGSCGTFTTDDLIAPEKDSLTPADTSTDVSINTPVSITFNEEMDPTTINVLELQDNGVDVLGTWNTADNITYTFTPDNPLEYSTVYDIVTTGPTMDLSGNVLPAGTCGSFTTEAAPPMGAPCPTGDCYQDISPSTAQRFDWTGIDTADVTPITTASGNGIDVTASWVTDGTPAVIEEGPPSRVRLTPNNNESTTFTVTFDQPTCVSLSMFIGNHRAVYDVTITSDVNIFATGNPEDASPDIVWDGLGTTTIMTSDVPDTGGAHSTLIYMENVSSYTVTLDTTFISAPMGWGMYVNNPCQETFYNFCTDGSGDVWEQTDGGAWVLSAESVVGEWFVVDCNTLDF